MSKRSSVPDNDSSSSASSTSKKRVVSVATVDEWVLDHDKTLNTATWLTYEKADRHHVALLLCSVCKRFEERIKKSRNFSPAFIDGTRNLRTSSFKDHAKSDMHGRAMQLLRREQSTSVTDYSQIAQAFYRMDQTVEKQTKMKFDVTYNMIAKEGVAFTKMNLLCQLQERHGVKLGECYKNDHACANFVEYIARDLQCQLGESLHKVASSPGLRGEGKGRPGDEAIHKAKFYSIQMDGSTDSGNKEEELFLVVYFDPLSILMAVYKSVIGTCVSVSQSLCVLYWLI